MSVALVGLAIVVVGGGIVAVAARESRVAIAGWSVAAVLAPLLGTTASDLLPALARVVAALLAAYLLCIAVRGAGPGTATRGSLLGWPADVLIAGAAAIAGGSATWAAPVTGGVDGVSLGGAREALMAGFALAALAVGPMLLARDALRLSLGLLVAVLAAGLIQLGMAGAPSGVEQLAHAGLVAALGAAAAALVAGSIRVTGGLSIEPSRRPGAHRPIAGEARPSVGPVRARSAGTRRIPGR